MPLRILHIVCLAAAAVAAPGLSFAPAAAQAQSQGRPARIVSLDLCTDQLLVALVGRERIAAVTHLAADPAVSADPGKAKGIPITHGAAEDVLRYDPDLVLAGPFGVTATVGLLRRLQRNVVTVPLPSDLDGVRAAMRAVAAAVGEHAKGEAMVAAFDRRLARLAPPAAGMRPSAIIYQVGGSVSGPGSLAEATLAAAGFRNKAADYRLTRGEQVPLELLVATPPDLLVLSSAVDEYRTALADNLRHPVLRRLRQRHASLELPWQLWLCGTLHTAEAIERLAEARVKIEARRP
ncbi:MAG: ABC transporter substrate-binding protein [Hyphomonadaceae bacterium]|nr:ABC transporter substrate-binding protein [Hyphomonadaceae bacterium]